LVTVTDTSIPPDTVDPDPSTYKRQFNDGELDQLDVEVSRRFQTLAGKGVPVNPFAILAHHIIGLLEVQVGPEKAKRVREWHLQYVSGLLDEAESALRVAQLLDSKP